VARLESVAVGGYYPTPEKVVPLIARLIKAVRDSSYLDPCAGDGEALLTLVEALHGGETQHTSIYAVELEKTRHEALQAKMHDRASWRSAQESLHGDAFKVDFRGEGVSLLYLNPPYDTDPEHGRLEQKFLARFVDALAPVGVLVFLVPFYALKASATTLAMHFHALSCFRFPDGEFEAYKQVALFATKRETALWEPDPAIVNDVVKWASDADALPALDDADGIAAVSYALPERKPYSYALTEWKMRPLDMHALLASTVPWMQTDRGGKRAPVPGIVPEGALDDLLVRKYPLAMPPRSAHIAAGIAAGIFNGARLAPDDAASPLPEILVKGVFDKEFKTVDEKRDKEGNVKALVQVQQPKLVTTVLDLSTSRYVTIKPAIEVTDAARVDDMTMADLLRVYGRGLMNVMLRQCPVLHEPSRDEDAFDLPKLARPLFHAQKHATMAAVKLLGGPGKARSGRAAYVLGEIGSGKTSVALAAARAVGSKRALVMCPPHLLTSWQDQIKAVTPWVKAVVLSDVTDVQRLADDASDEPIIAILSRETAKLGHAYASVARCGRCGAIPPSDVDHAKKRSRCEAKRIREKTPFGATVRAFGLDLLQCFPDDVRLLQVTRGPALAAARRWAANGVDLDTAWKALVRRGTIDWILDRALEDAQKDGTEHEARDIGLKVLELLLVADPEPEIVVGVAKVLYEHGVAQSGWSTPATVSLARRLLLLLPEVDVESFKALDGAKKYQAYGGESWEEWERRHAFLHGDGEDTWNRLGVEKNEVGKLVVGGHVVGDHKGALDAFALLAKEHLRWSTECGEPLYQAIPEPRRFPLATFIAKRHADLFDLLILDEGHEYATDGSAQERSAHRLTSLGIPTLLLTGTVMNGYAESLFTNQWALSDDFRREFARDERMRFIDRYGYRKRLVEDRDRETGKVVEYGSMSDRVERSERMIGDAPGVLPLFLLRYLLPMAVTLHKTDLAIDIPKCSESTEFVTPETKQGEQFRSLQTRLLQQITQDRFKEDLAGKLWGAMAEMPSYLDLATEDVGNTDEGRYEIRYPETVGGELVAAADPLPSDVLLPKERWLVDYVIEAAKEDRNVIVFAWHVKLLPRLARLLEKEAGVKTQILIPSKVPTAKRETWINQEVISKKKRVLLANPITVQTGLNNLVYFADEVWHENPACNPVVYRQAVGRVDRIGQKKPTRIVFPLYDGTSQVDLHSLLMQKVGVSMSADGLDGESAMQAAGVGEDSGFSSFAVGRQLYELLAKRS